MNHSQHFIQQRKLYMALPLLATPFIVMIFWALGGGSQAASLPQARSTAGLNTILPEAQLEGKEQWDKLSLYEQAASDSMRYEEARENDPYFDLAAFKTSQPARQTDEDDKLINAFRQRDRQSVDEIEKQVQEKLAQLQKAVNGNSANQDLVNYNAVIPRASADRGVISSNEEDEYTEQMERITRGDATQQRETMEEMEAMMNMIGEKNRQPDPEMQQIEGVLDKILDIQHPERVRERLQASEIRSNTQSLKIQPVTADNIALIAQPLLQEQPGEIIEETPIAVVSDDADSVGLTGENIDNSFNQLANGFFGLDNRQLSIDPASGSPIITEGIQAVVHDTQQLVAGSTVKLRLAEQTTIAGLTLPKDQFIHGTCQVNGERLIIKINSIRVDHILLPVAMSAYDLDGLEGIHIPGAITRDAAKQGSADALQSMQMMNVNPTIGAQAASAGIEAAKGLLTKKARLVKVTVKAGYQVLLKDNHSHFN